MGNRADLLTKRFAVFQSEYAPSLRAYIEKEHRLIQVSSFDIDKLIELFAAGYTLQPPDYKSLSIFEVEKEKENDQT